MARFNLPRDETPIEALTSWFQDMTINEKAYVQSKLGKLTSLMMIKINRGLLQALIPKWDPETCAFRFSDIMLSPTYEEYLQLSRLPERPLDNLPVRVPYFPVNDLIAILRIDTAVAVRFTTIHENNFP